MLSSKLLCLSAALISCSLFQLDFSEATKSNKLLVMLMDGFRWDYFNKFNDNPDQLAGFKKLRASGSSATRLIPQFPSLSFVNYYSLMTGLYPESHGIIDNYMYDPIHNTEFLIGDNPEQYFSYWWDGGEPLWITATKQGKNNYFWYWNGCEVEIRNTRPKFCSPYQSTPDPSYANFSLGVDSALEVLRNGSADVAGVFWERVDATGHKFGSNSVELKDPIHSIDEQLQKIQSYLETHNMNDEEGGLMADRINLVVFSDHGMTERVGGPTDNSTAVINVLKYFNSSDFNRTAGSSAGPILHIWPFPGDNQKDFIYRRLSTVANMTVYKKEDIPDKYHFKNNYRVAPIVLVADKGFVFLRSGQTQLTNVGYHGYDNNIEDMSGIFFAKGPDFKKNYTIPRLLNIDIYNVMCKILDIKPASNNGTWVNICGILSDPAACSNTPSTASTVRQTSLFLTYIVGVRSFLHLYI